MTDELRIAIENHRKMWEFIKEEEKDWGYNYTTYAPNLHTRYALKVNYLYKHTDGDEPHNECYLCDYAYKEYKRNDMTGTMCCYCPCLWGSEPYQHSFYCEPQHEGCTCWTTSPASDIMNLPIKPRLL